MSDEVSSEVLNGGCHCGAVRYRVVIRERTTVLCNCSICTKKGFVHLIVPEEDFELVQGADAITTYTFGTHTAKHHFCKHCGIHSYYRPRSHPDRIDVNVRCLEGIDPSSFESRAFDGRHWEEHIDELRGRADRR